MFLLLIRLPLRFSIIIFPIFGCQNNLCWLIMVDIGLSTECPKKVLYLINNRRKGFCSISQLLFVFDKRGPNLDFDLFFSQSNKNCNFCELKDKNVLNHETRVKRSLQFTFLCMKLSVPFIYKSVIYWFNLTRFLSMTTE